MRSAGVGREKHFIQNVAYRTLTDGGSPIVGCGRLRCGSVRRCYCADARASPDAAHAPAADESGARRVTTAGRLLALLNVEVSALLRISLVLVLLWEPLTPWF